MGDADGLVLMLSNRFKLGMLHHIAQLHSHYINS